MAATASPYGMVPINLIGGQQFAGSTRKLPIPSGYATSIFFGDVVKCVSDGTIAKDTGTATLTPVGIFMGVSYIDPVYGFTNRQMWTGATVTQNAAPAYAFVCDDPDTLFRIQANGSVATTALFENAAVVQGSGVVTSGNSGVSMNATTATTDTLPLRIVDFIYSGTSQPGDAFTDVIVKWNFGVHAYETKLGV